MTRLANDSELRARMGCAARAMYERMFTPQAVLPLLLDFYQSVIEAYAPGYARATQPAKRFHHPWSPGQIPLGILDPEPL